MKQVELYAQVRYAVQIEGLSQRAAARRFGIDPRTVGKMMMFSVPPGYVRTKAFPRSSSTRRSGSSSACVTSTASRVASRS
jgi:DNA-binding transcriptional regulator LsrR (DeoR family)